jgi:hypothetical protein
MEGDVMARMTKAMKAAAELAQTEKEFQGMGFKGAIPGMSPSLARQTLLNEGIGAFSADLLDLEEAVSYLNRCRKNNALFQAIETAQAVGERHLNKIEDVFTHAGYKVKRYSSDSIQIHGPGEDGFSGFKCYVSTNTPWDASEFKAVKISYSTVSYGGENAEKTVAQALAVIEMDKVFKTVPTPTVKVQCVVVSTNENGVETWGGGIQVVG